jgi:hypothetical protein
LAYVSGGNDALRVIEKFYYDLHKTILVAKLPLRAREIILPLLPELGWAWNWDLGLRFRLATATAYVRHEWPPRSYAMLAKSKKGRSMLASAASSIPGGDVYFKAASV